MSTTRAHVQFEDECPAAFRQLVRESLRGSEFIDTENAGEQMVIKEIEKDQQH